MTPTISKLKASYERLQESFSMENKLNFDLLVWSTLPELWKDEDRKQLEAAFEGWDDKPKDGRPLWKTIREFTEYLEKPITTIEIGEILSSKGYTFKQENIRKVLLRKFKNYRTITNSDPECGHLVPAGVKVIGCLMPVVQPKKVAKVGSKKVLETPEITAFQRWFEANYERTNGFTPIQDIIRTCDLAISEDVAKTQLKSRGYLIYNRPIGGSVQATRIKNKQEFVGLTEVLKEIK